MPLKICEVSMKEGFNFFVHSWYLKISKINPKHFPKHKHFFQAIVHLDEMGKSLEKSTHELVWRHPPNCSSLAVDSVRRTVGASHSVPHIVTAIQSDSAIFKMKARFPSIREEYQFI